MYIVILWRISRKYKLLIIDIYSEANEISIYVSYEFGVFYYKIKNYELSCEKLQESCN